MLEFQYGKKFYRKSLDFDVRCSFTVVGTQAVCKQFTSQYRLNVCFEQVSAAAGANNNSIVNYSFQMYVLHRFYDVS